MLILFTTLTALEIADFAVLIALYSNPSCKFLFKNFTTQFIDGLN